MKDMFGLMKQAQAMQQKMADLQRSEEPRLNSSHT